MASSQILQAFARLFIPTAIEFASIIAAKRQPDSLNQQTPQVASQSGQCDNKATTNVWDGEGMSNKAVFEGLVFDEQGRALEVTTVGGEAQYVIDDLGFRRHIDAAVIDRQVISLIQEQVIANKDIVEESIMRMTGQDDLFTKASLDVSIKNMAQLLERGIPDDARMWLGMMGLRIVVNLHGEVINLNWPGVASDDEGND
jgi:hypothetical protein